MKTLHPKLRTGAALSTLVTLLFAVLFVAGFASVAGAKSISTSRIKASDVEPGTYTLIKQGCYSSDEPGNVAFLQKEDAAYNIDVPGSERESGLTADQAVTRAHDFATCNPSALKTRMTEIKGPDGAVIGYEVTPIYAPLRYGAADPVDVHYHVKGNNVVAALTPDPMVTTRNIEGIGG